MPRFRIVETTNFILADGSELFVEPSSTIFFDGQGTAAMQLLQGAHPRAFNNAGMKSADHRSFTSHDPTKPLTSRPVNIVRRQGVDPRLCLPRWTEWWVGPCRELIETSAQSDRPKGCQGAVA
jgi:hypothetical protein